MDLSRRSPLLHNDDRTGSIQMHRTGITSAQLVGAAQVLGLRVSAEDGDWPLVWLALEYLTISGIMSTTHPLEGFAASFRL